mgnify:CR=1 FL=1
MILRRPFKIIAPKYSFDFCERFINEYPDIEKWEKRINNDYFIVAEANNQIIGFSYLTKGNYLDGLFVHKDYQRKTIGSKLLRIMESRASINGFDVLKSDVSITALPFFDSHYYEVEKKQKKSYQF